MNPEEGELRPQLLDRFGLCVEISGERDVGFRKSIVERVLLFEGRTRGSIRCGTARTRRCGPWCATRGAA